MKLCLKSEDLKEKCNKPTSWCYEAYKFSSKFPSCAVHDYLPKFLFGFQPLFSLIQLRVGKTALYTGVLSSYQAINFLIHHRTYFHIFRFMVVCIKVCLRRNIIQPLCNLIWPPATFSCMFYRLMDVSFYFDCQFLR